MYTGLGILLPDQALLTYGADVFLLYKTDNQKFVVRDPARDPARDPEYVLAVIDSKSRQGLMCPFAV